MIRLLCCHKANIPLLELHVGISILARLQRRFRNWSKLKKIVTVHYQIPWDNLNYGFYWYAVLSVDWLNGRYPRYVKLTRIACFVEVFLCGRTFCPYVSIRRSEHHSCARGGLARMLGICPESWCPRRDWLRFQCFERVGYGASGPWW